MMSRSSLSSVLTIVACVAATGCSRAPSPGASPERTGKTSERIITSIPPMSTPRGGHSATLLTDGRIFVVGGIGPDPSTPGSNITLSTSEIFDPVAGKWSAGPSLPQPVADQLAVRLQNGNVLIIGGDNGGAVALATTYIFDPTSTPLGWTVGPPLTDARATPAGAMLGDGTVLVTGGTANGAIPRTEIFSADASALLSGVGQMATPRNLAAATTLSDGRALVAGGSAADGTLESTAEIFDPLDLTWSTLSAAMTTPRRSFTLTPLDGSHVLAAGGREDGSGTSEILDTIAGTFSDVVNLPNQHEDHHAFLLPTGNVVLVGGGADDGEEKIGGFYNTALMTWTPIAPLTESRDSSAVVGTPEGVVYIIGGAATVDGGLAFYSTVDVFSQGYGSTPCALPSDCLSSVCTGGACVGDPAPDSGTDVGAEAISDSALEASADAAVDAGPDAVSEADAATLGDGDVGTDAREAAVGDDAATLTDASSTATPIVGSVATSCALDGECASGHCVDHVCCDSACVGACRSCALPESPGVCTFAPFGRDPRGDCDHDGVCVATCGGEGSCVAATGEATCAPSACVSTSKGVGFAFCSAAGGQCKTSDAVEFDCAPFACEPAFGGCASVCKTTDDCANGFVCDGAGQCVVEATSKSSGCTVGAARPRPSRSSGMFSLLVAIVAAGARRRRTAHSPCRHRG